MRRVVRYETAPERPFCHGRASTSAGRVVGNLRGTLRGGVGARSSESWSGRGHMSKDENLMKLVERLGYLGPLNNEHDRYAVYVMGLDNPELWPLLRECLTDEQDTEMATSVVVAAFECVHPGDRRIWAATVSRSMAPHGSAEISEFLITRIAQEEILDRVKADPSATEGIIDHLDVLSPEFERRIVARSTSRELLDALATAGTRRTRHEARERLRNLGPPDPPIAITS